METCWPKVPHFWPFFTLKMTYFDLFLTYFLLFLLLNDHSHSSEKKWHFSEKNLIFLAKKAFYFFQNRYFWFFQFIFLKMRVKSYGVIFLVFDQVETHFLTPFLEKSRFGEIRGNESQGFSKLFLPKNWPKKVISLFGIGSKTHFLTHFWTPFLLVPYLFRYQ